MSKHDSIVPEIFVHDGPGALEFYKRAFGGGTTPYVKPDGKKLLNGELDIRGHRMFVCDEFSASEGGTCRCPNGSGSRRGCIHNDSGCRYVLGCPLQKAHRSFRPRMGNQPTGEGRHASVSRYPHGIVPNSPLVNGGFMIRIALLIVAFSAATDMSAQTPGTLAPTGAREVIRQFKATEIAQGKDRAALSTDDALVFNAWDGRYEGRHAVDSLWYSLAKSGTFASSKIEEKATTYHKLSNTLWLVDYLEVLTGQRGKSGREFPPRKIHMTFIIARQRSGEWRISYFRAADAREFVNRNRAQDSTNVRVP